MQAQTEISYPMHTRDPYFDFIHLLTKLTSNQLLTKIIQYYILLFYITYVHAP